jgi:hypothetical protein
MLNSLRNAICWLWAHTDSTTKWLQVAALLFAAVWTYLIFKDTESPSLETTLAVSAELRGAVINPTTCELVAMVRISNPGLRTMEVDHMQFRMWLIKDIPLKAGLNYVDLENISAPPIDDNMPISALNTQYPPKTDLSVGFTFIYSGEQRDGWYYLARADAFNSKNRRLGYAYSLKRNICFSPKGSGPISLG